MTSKSPDNLGSEKRAEPRSSLFLGAALYCDGISTPTRIRNLSATGALVETGCPPEIGALVQLVRGSLIVHALVIWAAEGRCGLKFSGGVDVLKWQATPTNNEQERVDEAVRLLKLGVVPLPVGLHGEHAAERTPLPTNQKLASELSSVIQLLQGFSDNLADDSDVVSRHGTALQKLDISTQLIAAVQSILSGDTDACGAEEKLAGLRRSADQALLA